VPQDVSREVSDHGDFTSPGPDRSSAAATSFYYPGLDGLRGVEVLAVLL